MPDFALRSEFRFALGQRPAKECALQASHEEGGHMKGVVLWLFGVPISVILLLYLFGVL